MPTIIRRPNSDNQVSTGLNTDPWYHSSPNAGTSPPFYPSVSDNDAGTYSNSHWFNTSGGNQSVNIGTFKMNIADLPSDAVINSVRPYIKTSAWGSFPATMTLYAPSGIYQDTVQFNNTYPYVYQAGAVRTTRPGGGAWTLADINALVLGVDMSAVVANNNQDYLYVFDMYVEIDYTPAAPTAVQQTGDLTVTTPSFSASVAVPSGTVKARFELYQSDGTTLIGAVESALIANGVATATYPTPLAVGLYKVRAQAIDSGGIASAWTAQVNFQILTAVSKDRTLLWNTLQLSGAKDITALWNVVANNAKVVGLLWDTLVNASKDVTFKWNMETTWNEVNPDVGPEWGGKLPRDSDIWNTVEP